MNDVSRILQAIQHGDPTASDQLLPMVYEQLRRLAQKKLAEEPSGQTLQPTALVHEAYLRLVDDQNPQVWNSKGHFFAAAAIAMRRILIENVRRKQTQRRGRGWQRIDLEQVEPENPQDSQFLLALDRALDRLAQDHPISARIVSLRFFAGLSIEQTSEVLDVSTRTVNRHWLLGKAWLRAHLTEPPDV
jgi:RNA polymerase sigma factor (TIGR02999 family)